MALGKDFLKQYWEGISDQTKLNMLDGVGNILSSLPQTVYGYGQEMLNGVVQNFFNRKSLDYQAQLNEQAAVNAYNRQLDFWHKQNAYNSPAAQMNRLRQAGLNPALINANGVNNVAGGLSSVAARSPGSPDHSRRSPTDAVNSLVGFAKTLKEMGFLDEQTKTEIEKRLNLIAERGLKEVDKELRIEERDLARMNKIELFEALYGTSIDGGEPTIKNNRVTAELNEARSRKALNEAQEAYANAQESYTKAMEQYQNNKDSREAALNLAEIAATRAAAAASYKLIEKYGNDIDLAKNQDAREETRLELEKQMQEYLREINASQAEIAKAEEWLSKLWTEDDTTLMRDFNVTRGEIFRARWRDFIHSNLRLGGTAGFSVGKK